VTFGIKHGPWATVLGRFDKAAGEIVFDRDDVTKAASKLQLTPGRSTPISSGGMRISKARTFLNAAEHPVMTFESTKIERTGDKTARLTGNLTITGVTKPMVLNVTFSGEAPMGANNHVGFSAVGEIDINDYQIKKAIQFGFGPKIEIRIEVEANKK